MIGYELRPTIYVGNVRMVVELIDSKFQNILLLSSRTPYKYLSQNGVISNLRMKFEVEEYIEVEPNAPIDQLEKIKNGHKKPDLILAVGGGSVLDAAKALSVCWNSNNIEDVFYKREKLEGDKIPVFAIPSTAGTGAELSYGAILEDTAKGLKGGVRGPEVQPNQVLIDIELYQGAPKKLKAEVGFDNLTHAIETYISKISSPVVRYQSIAAIKVIFENLENAVLHDDTRSMEALAISASFMGLNLAKSSTCLPHRIQYVIGPNTNTSHAQGLIMLYRGWLPIIGQTEEFASLAAGLGTTREGLIEQIASLKKNLDLEYRLGDYGVSHSQITELASKVTGACENDPSYVGLETLEQIIKGSI